MPVFEQPWHFPHVNLQGFPYAPFFVLGPGATGTELRLNTGPPSTFPTDILPAPELGTSSLPYRIDLTARWGS